MYRSVKSRSSNSRTGVSSAFRFVPVELEAEPLAIDFVLIDLGGRGPADEAARSLSANCPVVLIGRVVRLALLLRVPHEKSFSSFFFHSVKKLALVDDHREVVQGLQIMHEAVQHRLDEVMGVSSAELRQRDVLALVLDGPFDDSVCLAPRAFLVQQSGGLLGVGDDPCGLLDRLTGVGCTQSEGAHVWFGFPASIRHLHDRHLLPRGGAQGVLAQEQLAVGTLTSLTPLREVQESKII